MILIVPWTIENNLVYFRGILVRPVIVIVFMPPKELWEAYSNCTVRPSVSLSVPLSCPVHISDIL